MDQRLAAVIAMAKAGGVNDRTIIEMGRLHDIDFDKEYALIQQKKSTLSARKRQLIVMIVESKILEEPHGRKED